MASWTVDIIREQCILYLKFLSNDDSVGLKVTSLKWTGPDPGSSELQPEIPPQIEYKDAVPRERDIGLAQEDNMQADLRSEQSKHTVPKLHKEQPLTTIYHSRC